MVLLGHVCDLVGMLFGTTLKLSYFSVKMLTMHRWFDISAAERDLGYTPIVAFADGWADTLDWSKQHWLPSFDQNAGVTGLSKGTEDQIAVQVSGTGAKAADAVTDAAKSTTG